MSRPSKYMIASSPGEWAVELGIHTLVADSSAHGTSLCARKSNRRTPWNVGGKIRFEVVSYKAICVVSWRQVRQGLHRVVDLYARSY